MLLLAFGRHLIWTRRLDDGRTLSYYYSDAVTWVVGALALAWVTWLILRRRRAARALRRPPRRADYRSLKRVVRIKSELSSRLLRPGFSQNIHAVGVGLLATGEYCLQVFVVDSDAEPWAGAGAARLPPVYRGLPLILVEMPPAVLLSEAGLSTHAAPAEYRDGIRERQEVIIGGISGANTNLTGQSGTIGYFCTRKSRLPRRKEIHLLSNSHVFADLRKAKVDEGDLIMQPSPGEPASNRPIGALVSFSELKFSGGAEEPNHIDAAIAKLWGPQAHRPVIPLIGAVKGHVEKRDVEVGEPVRKFGRTTGYTEGRIFSVYLDIRIRYDRTGQTAFFQNQLLVEPASPNYTKFVAKGDSGSLLVDEGQHAVGLIFAGTTEAPQPPAASPGADSDAEPVSSADKPRRVEGCGVANPISEVLERLKIELLV